MSGTGRREAKSPDEAAAITGKGGLLPFADDLPALKAAMAWPLVCHLSGSKLVKRWAEMAMVPKSEIKRVMNALIGHGVCRQDGMLDDTAKAIAALYVARMAGGKG